MTILEAIAVTLFIIVLTITMAKFTSKFNTPPSQITYFEGATK